MQKHKFMQGDMVIVPPDAAIIDTRPGIYLITQVSHDAKTGVQYRIKGLLDASERIIDEMRVRPANKS